MDNYERDLLNQALDLLHRIVGYADAKEQMKPPIFRIVPLDEKNNPFTQKKPVLTGIDEQGILKFNQKEIDKMPKKYSKLFKTNKVVAHVRKIKNKYFEIRVRIDGENYSASAKTLELAKERFIAKLYAPKKDKKAQKALFFNYVEEWMETVVQPYVKEITFNGYDTLLKKHIYPKLGRLKLSDIDSLTLQRFITELGSSRTCEKVFSLLNTIFNYAVPKDLPYSPMLHVKKPVYVPKETQPLSRQEEIDFINRLFETNSPYRYTYVLILYTGLRRSELKSATFDENFVIVKCAKQRLNHPDKERKIPISPMLRKYMPLGEIPKVRDDTLSSVFHELCPGHNLHNLRKTFNVRARTCGIPKPLVEFWMGHKPSRDDVNEMHYMHYDDEYQLREIQKFDYEYP